MVGKDRLIRDALDVFVLTSFAVAQPLYDRLTRRTVYLVDTGIQPLTLVLFVGLLTFALPAALVLIEILARGFGSRVRRAVHATIVLLLATLIALTVLRRFEEVAPGLLLVAALLAGLASLLAYYRLSWVRLFVAACAPAVLFFPGMFLFFSPATALLAPAPPVTSSGGAATVRVRNPVPIVVFLLDEFCGMSLLNDQHQIDAVRYPNFAALAQAATWYRNASSVHPRTEKAVPALLTGRYPRGDRRPIRAEYPVNLFTLLQATGQYEPVVFEPYTRLFPPEWDIDVPQPRSLGQQFTALVVDLSSIYLHGLMPPGQTLVRLPALPRAWFSLRDETGVRRSKRTGLMSYGWDSNRDWQFDHFLDCVGATPIPGLFFQHLVLPHFDWCYLPSGRKYTPDVGNSLQPRGTYGSSFEIWHDDDLIIAQAYQRYLLQVGCADRLLGRLIARLKQTDLYDRCLLIVGADHGVSFRRDELRRTPGRHNIPDLCSVPLFVKLPKQRHGRVSDQNVETVDLLPTIADVIGLGLPLETDGQSLCSPSHQDRPTKRFVTERETITLDAAFASKYLTLDAMLARFGAGGPTDRLFQIGPHPELLGRHVADLTIGPKADVQVEFRFFRMDYEPDPETVVPCYFEGLVVSPTPLGEPVDIALAVNGTVRAVTRTYHFPEMANQWCALVPETALKYGDNDIRAYTLSASASGLTLHPAHAELPKSIDQLQPPVQRSVDR